MERLQEVVSDPIWWITVVGAGVVLNLFTSYLKTLIDRAYLEGRKKRSARRASDEANYEARLQVLKQNPHNMAFLQARGADYMSYSRTCLLTLILVYLVTLVAKFEGMAQFWLNVFSFVMFLGYMTNRTLGHRDLRVANDLFDLANSTCKELAD
jgi:hypothetical protein